MKKRLSSFVPRILLTSHLKSPLLSQGSCWEPGRRSIGKGDHYQVLILFRIFLILRHIDYKNCVLTLAPSKVIGTNSIGQFTLMGVSAGAFGVAFNCDDVAAVVKAKDPNAGVLLLLKFPIKKFDHNENTKEESLETGKVLILSQGWVRVAIQKFGQNV